MASLKLYGVPLSQPFRSVAWTLLQKKVKFDIQVIVPGASNKMGSLNEAFLSKSRMRTSRIPLLEDNSNRRFTMTESPAILTYLCERFGWESLYGPPGSKQKAIIDSYLHWHHHGTRNLAIVAFPYLRPEAKQAVDNEKAQRNIEPTLRSLEDGWFSMQSPEEMFIAGTNTPTIADMLAYEEVVQLTMMGLLKNLDNDYPKIHAWTERMRQLPFHEEAHASLATLGDVITDETPVMKRLGGATKAGLKAMAQAQEGFEDSQSISKM